MATVFSSGMADMCLFRGPTRDLPPLYPQRPRCGDEVGEGRGIGESSLEINCILSNGLQSCPPKLPVFQSTRRVHNSRPSGTWNCCIRWHGEGSDRIWTLTYTHTHTHTYTYSLTHCLSSPTAAAAIATHPLTSLLTVGARIGQLCTLRTP